MIQNEKRFANSERCIDYYYNVNWIRNSWTVLI